MPAGRSGQELPVEAERIASIEMLESGAVPELAPSRRGHESLAGWARRRLSPAFGIQ